MIDFTHLLQKKKLYGGVNGGKVCLVLDGEDYMVKFPPYPTKTDKISYTNSCISEYIGCHIFENVGIAVQETLLGTYKVDGKEKIVCACKDFTQSNKVLHDFASLKNVVVDSPTGKGTELNSIMNTIDEQNYIDSKVLKEFFWNVFIVDALIGNWDRHNGNWGFLYDSRNDSIEIAPIYDCGSSLYPQIDEQLMLEVMSNKTERNHRIFNVPTSAICQNGKRINYFSYISSLENEDCNCALKRVTPLIDMKKINKVIEEIPCISDIQKLFYKTMLDERKKQILDFSLEKLLLIEREKVKATQKETNEIKKEEQEYITKLANELYSNTSTDISQSEFISSYIENAREKGPLNIIAELKDTLKELKMEENLEIREIDSEIKVE